MSDTHSPKHAAGEPGPEAQEPAATDDRTAAVVSVDTAGGAMGPSAVPATAQSGKIPGGPDTVLRKIFTGSGMVSVLAVLLALIIGGLLIASTDKQVATTSTYLFARPTDFLSAVWNAATRSYVALFQGSVFNPRGNSLAAQFAPFMETLTIATPLITAGLGVALAFRAGLFNIGAQGQIIVAGILAAWVGFALDLPMGLHLLLVLVAGIIGGAFWGGLVGLLKARTGAHEVILTIMFNYIALYFLRYLLNTPAFQRPGESNPMIPERQRGLDEALEIIDGMFGPEPVTFTGEHWQVVNAHITSPPVQLPRPPILIAGAGDNTLRQVVQWADVSNFGSSKNTGNVQTDDDSRSKLLQIDRLCEQAGRDPSTLLRSHFTSWLMLAESDSAAKAKLDHYFPDGLTEEQTRTRIFGSPATVIAYFSSLIEIGFEYFVVQIQDARDVETIRLLGTEVAPAFR
jgi:hypothetical protein